LAPRESPVLGGDSQRLPKSPPESPCEMEGTLHSHQSIPSRMRPLSRRV
jgi:hypothetical protein